MRVLGIETSCDETGIAVYDAERGLLAHALHSQVDMHAVYGGVVPELASRDHVRRIIPLIKSVLHEARISTADINGVAYTAGPGLIGALLVLDGGKLIGIMSERDYARKVILKGKSSLDTPVREIMTAKVFFIRPAQTVEECMALMTDKHIRHLPVMEGDKVVGVISIGDLVKATIEEKDFLIKQLENYITGGR